MKNIQIIDGAENCVYDIFAATDDEFSLIFPAGQDVAFIEELHTSADRSKLDKTFSMLWTRRLRKRDVHGIHGILFYQLEHKKKFYPTRRDEEAVNPNGSLLRRSVANKQF